MKSYKTILVAIDFSSLSDLLVQKAQMISYQSNSEIVLVHVISYSPPRYLTLEIPEVYSSEDLMVKHAENLMQKLISKITDKETRTLVRVGKVKRDLISIAGEIGADLIILGKHAPDITEKLLGSTAHSVVNNANCDMLIVHG